MKNCVENLSRSKHWLEKEQELRGFISHCEKYLKDDDTADEKIQGIRRNKAETEAKLAYMEEVLNLVNEIMIGYHITSKVRLDVSKDLTQMFPGLGFYNLSVKLFEHGPLTNPENRVSLATHIYHEMGHLINEDVKFFTAARGVTEITKELNKNKSQYPLHHRASIVLQVLSECRADLFGKKSAKTLFNGYSFDWVVGEKPYYKTGYLPAVDRQSLMNRFEEYNIDFVNFMFDSCFEAEGYLSRDILNEYLRTARVTAIPKSWAYQLLMGETK